MLNVLTIQLTPVILTELEIEEFQRLYFAHFGVVLPRNEAEAGLASLVAVCRILYRLDDPDRDVRG